MNTALLNYNKNIKDLVTNTTKFFLGSEAGNSKTANEFINQVRNQTVERLSIQKSSTNSKPRASVYVRINSSKEFQECRIVDVKPELDMAVLRIVSEPVTPYPFLKYGSSSNLLVGQTLIAIGNPFGLDQTVTSGVVSATNRPMTGIAGNRIPNCIQTDAAINPGNSGGPLLNSAGELIGINTAILSTSGSNAGIGFAVPSDPVQEAVNSMIQKDRVQTYKRPSPGYLGISVAGDSLAKSLQLKIKSGSKSVENEGLGLFVTGVADDSPAANLGMTQLEITKEEGRVILGDRIVAVGSNIVSARSDLEEEMNARVEGEQISLTLEDPKGGRRVVYLTLGAKKL
jgi:S1-C subfamily serine protease